MRKSIKRGKYLLKRDLLLSINEENKLSMIVEIAHYLHTHYCSASREFALIENKDTLQFQMKDFWSHRDEDHYFQGNTEGVLSIFANDSVGKVITKDTLQETFYD